MRAFYLSKTSAVFDADFGATFIRHALQIMTPAVDMKAGSIATTEDGTAPAHPFTLALVYDTDHTRYRNDPNVLALPDLSPSSQIGSMETAEKLTLKANLVTFGMAQADVDAVFANTASYRSALEWLGALNEPGFTLANFDAYGT